MARRARSPAGHRQRGATLIEALLAFVVLGIASVAGARLQSQLRLEADLARDRVQAARLGERDLERLRSYATLGDGSGLRSYAGIASDLGSADPLQEATGVAGAVTFRIERQVEENAFAAGRDITVAIRWADRQGTQRSVTLHAFVARIDPAHAGALGLGAGAITAAPRGYLGRHPAILIAARDLGDGRSLWKPQERGRLAFLLDNRSGDVIGRCAQVASERGNADLTAADATDCTSMHRLLISGTVTFASTTSPPPAAAADLAATSVRMTLDGSSGEAAECSSEPMKTVRYATAGSLRVDAVPAAALAPAGVDWLDTGERYVAWQCAVAPGPDGSWSGRADVAWAGSTPGIDASAPRVCRLSRDVDGSGRIDANIEHPASYSHVSGPLTAQNFVVVAGNTSCPPASVQHQP